MIFSSTVDAVDSAEPSVSFSRLPDHEMAGEQMILRADIRKPRENDLNRK